MIISLARSLEQVHTIFIRLIFLKGAFGEVRLCTHRKSGAKRAVKIIKKSFLQGKEETRFLSEIEILKQMVRVVAVHLL